MSRLARFISNIDWAKDKIVYARKNIFMASKSKIMEDDLIKADNDLGKIFDRLNEIRKKGIKEAGDE